jgi:integral membrane protein (TIGR00529 family)
MTAALLSVPYLARILVSLLFILIFQKITKSLEMALLAGIAIIALWTGHGPGSAIGIVSSRVFSWDNLFLILIIVGVIWLSSLMSEAGIMKDLVASLRPRLSKRAMLAALPGVVGLLPMPAGALFSAPLVEDCDDEKDISSLLKTRINYWFRHVWEFWWPLYPGVLLATDISGLPIWRFVILMVPLYFVSLFAGYLFLLRKVRAGKPDRRYEDGKAFLPLVLPTIVVIGVYSLILILFPRVSMINKYLPMVIGVVAGIAVIQFQRPATWVVWKRVILSRRTLGLALIVLLARVYGAFIEAKLPGGGFLMDQIRSELDLFGIPLVALIVLIPFISGLTTGLTVGYIGASFPVIIRLIGTEPSSAVLFSTVILGHTSGFLGMIFSPIHVCLIVTNEYFKTNLLSSLTGLWKPGLMVFGCAACYAGILGFLGG